MENSFLSKITRLLQGLLSRRPFLAVGLALFAVILLLLSLAAYNYLKPSQDATSSQSVDPSQTPEQASGLELDGGEHLIIEAIDVTAPLITLGLDANAIPEVPLNGHEVTWYNFSAPPGSDSNAVFAAHVTWNQQPAVFWDLDSLQAGDSIVINNGEGGELVYEVFANFGVDSSNPEAISVMAPTSEPILTLITCGGTWVPDSSQQFGGEYTQRIVVQAHLVGARNI